MFSRLSRLAPGTVLLFLLLLQALVWVLLPWWSSYSLPLDVVEGLFWGQEWQWGYYKHPPLPAWLLQLSWLGLGDLGPFVLSQLTILSTLLFVWLLGRRLFDAQRALLGSVLLLGVYYFIWPTPEYNHNIAQMPLWAAAVYCFHRALERGHYRDWAWLGLCAGLAMLTKYVVVMLLASMFLYLLLERTQRRHLVTPQLWLGVLVLVLVISPHLLWLYQHDFMPLTYAQQRSDAATGLAAHVVGPLKFLLVQALDHLPLLLILLAAGLLVGRYWSVDASDRSARRFLWTLGLGPACLTALGAAITGAGLRDMWGTPMWNLSGLLVVAYLQFPLSQACWTRLLRVLAIYLCVLALVYGLVNAVLPSFKNKVSRTGWPDREMAHELEQVWQQQHSGCAVRVVAGEYWLAGLLSLRMNGRPSVLIEGELQFSPWLTEQRLREQGVLWVWRGSAEAMPAALRRHGEPDAQGELQLAWPRNQRPSPLQLGWAIQAPKACQ